MVQPGHRDHHHSQEGGRQVRRTLAVAAAVGAIAAVSAALLVPTGAGAAQTSSTIDSLCTQVPLLQAATNDGLIRDASTWTTASETVAARRAAMTTAMTELAGAIVFHLATVDRGGDTATTGAYLKAKQAAYVATVVDWSKARTQVFDAEQLVVFGELQNTLLNSLKGSACP